jgi:squalene-hopene/tetraprenyl-beta-curcumene cyclase
MKLASPILCVLGILSLGAAPRLGAQTVTLGAGKTNAPSAPSDVSFRHEVEHAIDRGLDWLRANQNSNGWWSTPDHPAITALAVTVFLGEPSGRARTNPPPEIKRALDYLIASVQPDGSIQRGKLANYNTAISLVALALAGDPAYNDLVRRGRAFLIGSQILPGPGASPFAGGVGYGDKERQSDLVNTLTALEALRATEYAVWKIGGAVGSKGEKNEAKSADLNWDAAIQFIERCQNLPKFNTNAWVSTNPKDLGGFVYSPVESKAGAETNSDTGRVALRSYGSISYAGLLSYIYADVKGDDPHVQAVMDWLRANYTLDENPGLGEQGLYYYLHLMTKGLNAAGVDQIELKDGRRINWRREVSMHLLDLQQRDGSWVNRNNRWWEKDPCLVTPYSLLALEIIVRKL